MKFVGIISFCAAAAAATPLAACGKCAASSPTSAAVNVSISTGLYNAQHDGPLLKADVVAKAKKLMVAIETPAYRTDVENDKAPHGKVGEVSVCSEIKAIIDILGNTANGEQHNELSKEEHDRVSAIVVQLNTKLDAPEKHIDNISLAPVISRIEVEIKSTLAKLQSTQAEGQMTVHANVELLVKLLSLLTAKVEAEVEVEVETGSVGSQKTEKVDVQVHGLTVKLAGLLKVKADVKSGNVHDANVITNIDGDIHRLLVDVLGLLRVDISADVKVDDTSTSNTVNADGDQTEDYVQFLDGLLRVLANTGLPVHGQSEKGCGK
ncbi:hypothetical protein NOR_06613 [Metarhizium rileyi]|uniref:Uncharacterized protein n=1 Tax=Metarhizium rileyi (strain RCEF 4871) TaxID=1649241 RepID=A0A167A5X4_METRR|nr:hypothetical protein NOR_06613 [Metarhizium rileyi RCEF 4871]